MGLYDTKVYRKDSKGKWRLHERKIDRAPHEVGRWQQNARLERESKTGDYTFYQSAPTRGGLNQKVVRSVGYVGDREKIERNLITTSNKLPKSYKSK